MIVAAVLAVIAWGALAFGAVYPWAYTPLLAACAAIGMAALLRPGPSMPRGSAAVLFALGCVLLAGLLQLVPLPTGVLRTISPATDAFLRNYSLAYVVDGTPHPLSINPAQTWLGLGFLAAFLVFLAGLLRGFSRSGVERLAAAIIVFGVILALVGIVQKALLGDHVYMGMKIYGFWSPESRLVQPFGPFVNRNHFAGWMLMAIPLAVGYLCAVVETSLTDARPGLRNRLLWLSSPEGGRTTLVGFAVIVMTLSLAMSMSRSGMAAFAVAAALVGWRLIAALRSPSARVAAAALIVALVAVPVLWLGVGSTVDRFSNDQVGSVGTRLHVWRDTHHIIRDFPLVGTGLNTFGTATVIYQSGTRDVHFQEAHSDYLQLAAEGGALLVVPAAIAIALFIRAVRRRFTGEHPDRTSYWIRLGAVCGLVAIALQSLVEFSLQMPGNAALFVVFLAIALHDAPSDTRAA
jgi:O-antigen ligase